MATVLNANEVAGAADAPEWARRYPPLLTLLAALAIAVIVLPSALNQPQANPSTTLELAPVPPTNDKTPPIGNLNQLGLGQSSSLNAGGALGGDNGLLPPIDNGNGPNGGGRNAKTKRCVGKPSRQTEDPLAPPCVAFFPDNADNGGATYQGVTKDAINIVFYEDGASVYTPTARGNDNTPTSQLIDLNDPPKQGEIGQITTRRFWQKYFNDRYQLYGRNAHFYIYYGSGSSTPEARQADAAQAFAQINKPFATISHTALTGGADDFLTFMAQRGVLNFGSLTGRAEDFFNRYPKLIWGYPPAVEFMGRNYVDFVCKTLGPYKTSFGGAGTGPGQPRKYGVIATKDTTYPNLVGLKKAIESGLKGCGITIADEALYPKNNFYTDTQSPPTYASTAMARFKNEGITTILWAGGVEEKYSAAAANANYHPEIVTLGDGYMEANGYGQAQNRQVWANAWTVTPTVKIAPLDEQICYQAYRSVDPDAADSDVANFACEDYDNLRQLFTGIQVAGPKLGPFSIDKGFHAIPSVESPDPRLPACYYEPGDYTCVKDMQAEYWDNNGLAPGATAPGCWKEALGGKRYRAGTWPATPILTLKNASDPCNIYDATQNINNKPPDPNGG
jgi:hypothetical protein